MNKFWNFRSVKNEETQEIETELRIDGYIAEESWFSDEVTPAQFMQELDAAEGNIVLWVNSFGGDAFAGSRIYTALQERKQKSKCSITVKVDGVAASAASVICMAGDPVLMSPTGICMIHNPWTYVAGEVSDLEKCIDLLNEVKESILNAYQLKTNLSRAKLSHLMDSECWMNAQKAIELGFADGMLYSETDGNKASNEVAPFMWNSKSAAYAVVAAMRKKYTPKSQLGSGVVDKLGNIVDKSVDNSPDNTGIPIAFLDKRLSLLKA